MASFPLGGTVSKAALLVSPFYAQDKELLHALKFRLVDAGFIIVREEYRRVNTELANELCVQMDSQPAYMLAARQQHPQNHNDGGGGGVTSSNGDGSNNSGDYAIPEAYLPTAAAMVGSAYVYSLAHRNCHAELQKFLARQLFSNGAEDEGGEDGSGHAIAVGSGASYRALLESIAAKKLHSSGGADSADDDNSNTATAAPPAVFVHRTADGSRQAVGRLYPRMLALDIPTGAASREYVQSNLKLALLPVLTELAKKKPADPLRWIADQLLMNNPQSPPMVNEGE